MLSTGGDLLFSGHNTGRFVAYDADTLKEVWDFNLGSPITAPAMSYSVNGKQYIAIIVGGEANMRGAQLYQPGALVAVFGL
jgi:alcohol dehydrogenase (cytochrome c)